MYNVQPCSITLTCNAGHYSITETLQKTKVDFATKKSTLKFNTLKHIMVWLPGTFLTSSLTHCMIPQVGSECMSSPTFSNSAESSDPFM